MPDARTSTRPLPASSALIRSASASAAAGTSRAGDANVLLHLGERGITATASASVRALDGVAEQERGGEPVSRDVVAEADHVAGLLAAEHAVLTAERLEHVAVSDLGRDDSDPAFLHQPVEAEVRHHGHRDEIDPEVEREHGQDLVAVDLVPVSVHGEHAVAVAVEGDAEVEPAGTDGRLEERRSVAPHPR